LSLELAKDYTAQNERLAFSIYRITSTKDLPAAGDHEPLARCFSEFGRERRLETGDLLLEVLDFLNEKGGERFAQERAVEGVKPRLESGDLMDSAAEVTGVLEKAFPTFGQASQYVIELGEVFGCGGTSGRQDCSCS
jgi:hypothetical protein